MDSLIVENVRCFHKRQTPRLAPLTLLVGENSSGKSTFLALLRVAWDIARGGRLVDFNEAPFSLGTYEQIATFRGGRGGRAKEFTPCNRASVDQWGARIVLQRSPAT